ncbi:MAG: HD domain-containing protein [Spirochaetales bacterium]|nr:HD domain-containing protein [Spirochaetales bacterium]
MNRLDVIEKILQDEIGNRPHREGQDNTRITYLEIAHAYSVSLLCRLLARKRGLDEELCAIIGYLHDLGRIRYNIVGPGHASPGAEDSEKILGKTGLFSEAEIRIIVSAIRNHDDKHVAHGPYDELVKDADSLDRSFHYRDSKRQELRSKRYSRVLKEFGVPE